MTDENAQIVENEEVTTAMTDTPPLPPSDTGTPEVMESLPDNFTPSGEIPENTDGEIYDSKGNAFNPSLHIAPDRLNKDGTFRKRNKSSLNVENEEITNGSENVSKTIVFFFSQTGKAIFGEKFEPNKEERSYLEKSMTAYLETKDITDIPPGVAVTIAFASFTVAKMREEECRKNGVSLFKKIKEKVTPIFRKVFRRG